MRDVPAPFSFINSSVIEDKLRDAVASLFLLYSFLTVLQGVLRPRAPFTSAVTHRCRRITYSVTLSVLSVFITSHCQAQARDVWGLRVGILGVPAYPGAHPLVQPFYETPTSYVD